MQVRVMRAHLRIDTLLALHRARLKPYDPITTFTSYPTAARALDRVITDVADVFDSWHSVRAIGPVAVARRADEVLESLAGLLADIDPGWHRPRARARARRRSQAASTRFTAALAPVVTDHPHRPVPDLGRVLLGHDRHPRSQGGGIRPVTVHCGRLVGAASDHPPTQRQNRWSTRWAPRGSNPQPAD
jgi:hypothetical protein